MTRSTISENEADTETFPHSLCRRLLDLRLVGGGKVGTALARQLSEEGHNVTVIDTNKARVEHIGESYDVMSILGNGSSIITLFAAMGIVSGVKKRSRPEWLTN